MRKEASRRTHGVLDAVVSKEALACSDDRSERLGRSDADRARDSQRDVLATILVTVQLRYYLHVHGQLVDARSDALEQRGLDLMSRGRCVGLVLDADEQRPASAVRKADTVVGELGKVSGGASDLGGSDSAVEVLGLVGGGHANLVGARAGILSPDADERP